MSTNQIVIKLSETQQNHLMEKHNVKTIDEALLIEKNALESSINLSIIFSALKEYLPILNTSDEEKLIDMLCKKFNLEKKQATK